MATKPFVGQIYGITVWDYAFSSSEIAGLFDAGICGGSTTKTKPIISYEDIVSQKIYGAASLVELEDASCKDDEVEGGDESGEQNVLNFPSASNANYISYRPGMPALSGFTVCSWQKKFMQKAIRFWFSYASSGTDNEILLGEKSGQYTLYLGGSGFSALDFGATFPENDWIHLCVTWDSTSGLATFYLNGKEKKSLSNTKKGYTVRSSGNLVIAQDQDSIGGGFDGNQAFVGQIYGITVWDYAFSSSEIAGLFDAGICGGSTTKTKPIISYEDIISQKIYGAASLVELEDASCKDAEVEEGDESDEVEEDESDKPAPCDNISVNEDCWTTEQKTEYKRKKNGNLGNLKGTVEEAKLACSVMSNCKALTCSTKKGKSRCELRSSTKKSNSSKKKTSYIYTC